MVSLTAVQSSNSRIATALPSGLIAVFVGATRGIGETALKQFAKYARAPRIYFTGRSQEAGDRVVAECKVLNPEGQYFFLQADTSLLRNVDEVCRDIKGREKSINLLFLTSGSLDFYKETSEGLRYASALAFYSRTRFLSNLLPLLQQAQALRRVVNVLAGGKEGPLDTSDFEGYKVPMLSQRGHAASLLTLSLEAFAARAPDVSFIHNFPGLVQTDLAKEAPGVAMFILRVVTAIIGPFFSISLEECGERHLFLATSAKYPAREDEDGVSGVPVEGGLAIARGASGAVGGGVYAVGSDGESAGTRVEALVTKFMEDGVVEKVQEHTEEVFNRIVGSVTA